MPTKEQMHRIWETEMEFPETRREDDPMYRSPNNAKPIVIRSVCLHLDTYVDDDNFIRCSACDEIVDA